MMAKIKAEIKKAQVEWMGIIKKYQTPDKWKSTWQIVNTMTPFLAIWVLMYYSLEISYWLTLGLGVINAGLMVRLFIIQHDCGHNSFFPSLKLNNIVGNILSVFTLTPYYHWRKQHARHHANSGDLDFRGFGDIETVTVREYQVMSRWEKFRYRFYRNPFVTFVIGPVYVFVFSHRISFKTKKSEKKERSSVKLTNAALIAVVVGMGLWIGFDRFFMVQIPITVIGSMAGVYMFYVQHQFEETYWRNHKDWDYTKAALEGSSYFKLPKILQWFTGNIGFHHVHHLSPLVPNYLLEKAHNENPMFQNVKTLTLKTSIKTIFMNLWDEQQDRLISFREYRKLYIVGAAA